eukprot:6057869-Heterocapsa_arctica.AAC.1
MVAARSSHGHGSKRCFATKVEMHSGSVFLKVVLISLVCRLRTQERLPGCLAGLGTAELGK